MENLKNIENLKSHFLNLYSIALSDNHIDTIELELLYKFGEERGIKKEEIEEIILNPNKVKFIIPEDILTKVEYLYDFARMVWADTKIDEFEIKSLIRFCIKFGFEENNAEAITNFLIEEAKNETPKIDLFEKVKQNLNN